MHSFLTYELTIKLESLFFQIHEVIKNDKKRHRGLIEQQMKQKENKSSTQNYRS